MITLSKDNFSKRAMIKKHIEERSLNPIGGKYLLDIAVLLFTKIISMCVRPCVRSRCERVKECSML